MESCFLADETPHRFSLIRFFTRDKDCLSQLLGYLGAIGWFGNQTKLGRLRWRILQKPNASTQRIYQIGGQLFRGTSIRFRLTAFYSIQSTESRGFVAPSIEEVRKPCFWGIFVAWDEHPGKLCSWRPSCSTDKGHRWTWKLSGSYELKFQESFKVLN